MDQGNPTSLGGGSTHSVLRLAVARSGGARETSANRAELLAGFELERSNDVTSFDEGVVLTCFLKSQCPGVSLRPQFSHSGAHILVRGKAMRARAVSGVKQAETESSNLSSNEEPGGAAFMGAS